MEFSDKLNQLIGHLCSKFSQEKMVLDEEGRCALAIKVEGGNEQFLLIDADRDGKEAVASVILGSSGNASRDFLLELLGANYFWHQTFGGTLAYDHDSRALVLQKSLEVEAMGEEDFTEAVEDLASAGQYWRQRLEEDSAQNATPLGSRPESDEMVRV